MKINNELTGPSRPEFIFNHPPGGAVEVGYVPTFPGEIIVDTKNECKTKRKIIAGLYKIHIKFFGRDIPGSPFPVDVVGDSQIKVEMVRDVIQNVKISGPAATNGRSLITNQFLLDAREAIVSGGLNAFMQGPGNVEVGFKENLDGNFFFLLINFEFQIYLSFL